MAQIIINNVICVLDWKKYTFDELNCQGLGGEVGYAPGLDMLEAQVQILAEVIFFIEHFLTFLICLKIKNKNFLACICRP